MRGKAQKSRGSGEPQAWSWGQQRSQRTPPTHQPRRRRNAPSKVMIMARIAHHRKGPESCSSAPTTLLQDKAQPVPPSYRHTNISSTREQEMEPPTARENLQAKKKKLKNQSAFLGGEKSNAGRQRHRRREPRPGPSMPQIYRDAKRKPEEIRANLLNKCN